MDVELSGTDLDVALGSHLRQGVDIDSVELDGVVVLGECLELGGDL